jgi:hypothetical protein
LARRAGAGADRGAIGGFRGAAANPLRLIALAARLGRTSGSDFIDWLAEERVDGANMISASTAAGSIRRALSPRRC